MAMAVGNDSNFLEMDVEEEDFAAMRESVELRHGLMFIIGTISFFNLVNWIVKSYGPPKSLKDEEWKWRNLYVSWVHALITSLWTLTCMIVYPEMFSSLLQHINYVTYFCVCFGTGYFFYDLLDLILNNKFFIMWEVVVHHIAVASMFYYNVHIRAHIGFNIIALSVEVNSFFLHWRKLLQMVKTPYDSPKYLAIKYLNLTTFIVFRGVPLSMITYCCFVWRHRVSAMYYVGICLSIFVMDVLNVILFWRLLKSDMLRGPEKKIGGLKTASSAVCENLHSSNGKSSNGHVLVNGYKPSLKESNLLTKKED
ncbi:TLC domain-containing protein 2-like [Biomphalaria glabrata]|uniref:TLC domain-containing protein 2-like n=1 Tax=Biomphalaria glabrata TaxID=6526 RepID=A0A2C9LHU0_BIOGL|nr:TLC domain-containing protein 2-like [Biomphalaria glabrata]KAI8783046.1 TLC domain-containing protein 2 [Biomphalaria glabrata]